VHATPGGIWKPGNRIVVAKRALLDTGFVVALVNANDPDHGRCVDLWRDLHAHLFSVEGVLVECAHVLRRTRGGPRAAVRLIEDAGVEIVSIADLGTGRAIELMGKYADVPMDFVDALLVTLGEKHAVRDVLTLDRRGFAAYRANGRERFQLFP
jgi:predicted nucleic acid-binding protein